jgi:uncharacterized protein (DUF2249 family)
MLTITPSTRISAILKAYPQALEAIVNIAPPFSKLRNPVLRRLLAGRVSVQDAARIGKCTLVDFYNAFQPFCSSLEGFDTPDVCTTKDTAVFSAAQKSISRLLDVRETIAAGDDPFRLIMDELSRLSEGQLLRLVNSFEPTPLLRILEKKGFSYEINSEDGLVTTWIARTTAARVAASRDPLLVSPEVFAQRLSEFGKAVREVDVRQLEMPGPMLLILDELTRLEDSHALLVQHKKIPLLLLPELEEKSFQYNIADDGGHIRMLIYRSEEEQL